MQALRLETIDNPAEKGANSLKAQQKPSFFVCFHAGDRGRSPELDVSGRHPDRLDDQDWRVGVQLLRHAGRAASKSPKIHQPAPPQFRRRALRDDVRSRRCRRRRCVRRSSSRPGREPRKLSPGLTLPSMKRGTEIVSRLRTISIDSPSACIGWPAAMKPTIGISHNKSDGGNSGCTISIAKGSIRQ